MDCNLITDPLALGLGPENQNFSLALHSYSRLCCCLFITSWRVLRLPKCFLSAQNEPPVLGSSCSQNNPQPMTDRNWRINTPTASPLGWDNSEVHVLKSFPELPSGIKLQRPTMVTCSTPRTGNRTQYMIEANGIPR